MEFIRIPNAIVTITINASHRINYVKQNVQAIKNLARIQVDVVQPVVHQCHVVHIFQEVPQLKVCFSTIIIDRISSFVRFSRSLEYGNAYLHLFINDCLLSFLIIIYKLHYSYFFFFFLSFFFYSQFMYSMLR